MYVLKEKQMEFHKIFHKQKKAPDFKGTFSEDGNVLPLDCGDGYII